MRKLCDASKMAIKVRLPHVFEEKVSSYRVLYLRNRIKQVIGLPLFTFCLLHFVSRLYRLHGYLDRIDSIHEISKSIILPIRWVNAVWGLVLLDTTLEVKSNGFVVEESSEVHEKADEITDVNIVHVEAF